MRIASNFALRRSIFDRIRSRSPRTCRRQAPDFTMGARRDDGTGLSPHTYGFVCVPLSSVTRAVIRSMVAGGWQCPTPSGDARCSRCSRCSSQISPLSSRISSAPARRSPAPHMFLFLRRHIYFGRRIKYAGNLATPARSPFARVWGHTSRQQNESAQDWKSTRTSSSSIPTSPNSFSITA